MDPGHSANLIKILCKSIRGTIYLAALIWMIWFYCNHRPRLRRALWLFFVGIPLITAGFLVGLFGESQHMPGFITEVVGEVILSNLGTALILGSLILLVIDISKVSQRHKQDAETDPLTGLFNRRFFFAEADRVMRNAGDGKCRPSVAIFDVDYLKDINDKKGHQFGDDMLKKAAHEIKRSIRKCDVPARYGGDEFAVLFPDEGPDLETLKTRLQKNLNDINEEIEDVPLSLSVGLARFPADGASLDELLSAADTRMYADKNTKKPVR